jgi:hypothetical protein
LVVSRYSYSAGRGNPDKGSVSQAWQTLQEVYSAGDEFCGWERFAFVSREVMVIALNFQLRRVNPAYTGNVPVFFKDVLQPDDFASRKQIGEDGGRLRILTTFE